MAESRIFSVETAGRTLVVSLNHNIGSFADADVQEELNVVLEAIETHKPAGLVIDFAGISYFGSSILEALRVIWNRHHGGEGPMALCNLETVGREIIEVSKFDTLWPICNTRVEAIDAVSSE